jgi:hypothetical protein
MASIADIHCRILDMNSRYQKRKICEAPKLHAQFGKYTLQKLTAQCDPTAPMPSDLIAWDRLQPIGHEFSENATPRG